MVWVVWVETTPFLLPFNSNRNVRICKITLLHIYFDILTFCMPAPNANVLVEVFFFFFLFCFWGVVEEEERGEWRLVTAPSHSTHAHEAHHTQHKAAQIRRCAMKNIACGCTFPLRIPQSPLCLAKSMQFDCAKDCPLTLHMYTYTSLITPSFDLCKDVVRCAMCDVDA